ncbi:1,2-phenylacetyl-CoA epoxidase subunit PaaD [Cryobacterium melibiosiphilum]|uniref:1,2-phenylacetyl-CoA epoxidase subunit PaaD n=1 Tax=Cryobacterium melibiosiphilum TaxID=995039 RepID=UPI00361F040E
MTTTNPLENRPAALLEAIARPRPTDAASRRAWALAATVTDPELPVLTIEDLGVLRSASVVDGHVTVTLTPTYSGCPAMHAMQADVAAVLRAAGYASVVVRLVLSPAWSTDWMSAAGAAKLREYGIAPPAGHAAARPSGPAGPLRVSLSVKCPRCSSLNTSELTRFGSTSCKSLWQCRDCLEPFDYFKVL